MSSQFSGVINRISFTKIFKFFEKHHDLMNKLVYFVSFLALISGVATYAALSEIPPFGTISPDTLFWLLNLDLIFFLVLGFLVARRVVSLWIQKKKGMAGSNLHIRLVMIFSLLATLPAIFMAVFAIVFYHYGVEAWFGDRISTAVTESREVAQSYLNEHRQTIRADILAMANDMNRDAAVLTTSPNVLTGFIKTQSLLRNFTEIIVFDSNRNVIASGIKGASAGNQSTLPPPTIVQKAEQGEVIILTGSNDRDKVHALVRLNNYANTYLYVGRSIEEGVLKHITMTEQAVQDYSEIEGRQHSFKITMAFIFIVVSLLLLLIAVTIGLIFAEHLARPIGALVDATERVRAGDLSARVHGEERSDETGILARAFNRMTEQLSNQRLDLINANKQIDDRRRFTEAVLSGVSAGILSMDEEGHITLANESATTLIGAPGEEIIGRKLNDVNPEMEKLRRAVRRKPTRVLESEITLEDNQGKTQTWVVRMSAEGKEESVRRYVATFDNVTPLMNAQRKAAWSGVARRIAHEIKNPLTPIQLSAERLRKKYLDQIKEDPETFDICTSTIIKHVEDIGRMVDEFSSFARMPTAQKRQENLTTVARQVLFLFQQGHPNIDYRFDDLPDSVQAECDSRQISQALTNLLKNATESVVAAQDQKPDLKGKITFSMHEEEGGNIVVAVNDNGMGLPKNLSGKLTDPYVTTREKGTGLGLAIVSKIMEDHQGHIDLLDNANQEGGATAKLIFPKKVSNT